MNVRHSPTRSMIGNICESGGGSTSNLSNYDEEEQLNKNPRKRRAHTLEYDFKKDLAEFRTEIMEFIKEVTNNQIENITQMRNEIRQDIQDLKSTTEKLTIEYKTLQESVEIIATEHKVTQNKLITIEDEINKLKDKYLTQDTSFLKQQEIYQEIQDRLYREKNIIMVGLKEQNNNDNNYDFKEVHNILSNIYQECPMPLKITRLGKYNGTKPRPLKIVFDSSEIAKCLLKNKSKCRNGIKIYSDQTPSQRDYMHKLQIELKNREQNGENNLTIKYLKGVPTIISNNNMTSKN